MSDEICDDVDYQAALIEVERLTTTATAPGTPEYERLEFLSVLIEGYEDEEFGDDGDS